MNKSTIRIFCIFVMIMYCLAPISAIDLNQDNNTQLENANNNENDSIDETVGGDKTEMKTAKSSPSDESPAEEAIEESDGEIENETVTETEDNTENTSDDENESNPEEGTPSDFSVKVCDIKEGETANIEINAGKSVKGIAYFTITNNNGEQTGVACRVDNGAGQVYVKNLKKGTYTVMAEIKVYADSSIYESERKYTSFTVKEKYDPNLNIDAESEETGTVKIGISANSNISDPVKIKLNNCQEYSLKLENGLGTLTIDELSPGEYEATVSYDGDSYYKASEKTIQFIIQAETSPSDDNPAEEDEKQENETANETEDSIENTTDDANETENITENTTDDTNETTPEKWTSPSYSIQIEDILEGETANVQVNVDRPEKGWVYLYIRNDNGEYEGVTVDIENGVGQKSIQNLSGGRYTVSAELYVIENYTAIQCERKFFSFTVKERYDSCLNIDVKNNETGKTEIEISANENISDSVKIRLNNSQEYGLKLENGTGTITIDDLPLGEYEVTAIYDGDIHYKPATKTTQFIIKAKPDFRRFVIFLDTSMGTGVIINADELVNDDVKVIIEGDNGYYKEKTVKLTDKKGYLQIVELEPGKYNITVLFDGNKYMEPGSVKYIYLKPEIPIDTFPDIQTDR